MQTTDHLSVRGDAPAIDTAAIRRLAVNDSGFVFDPITGRSFTVNATGRRLLALMRDQVDAEGLIAALADEYEVENDDLRRDLHDFVRLLREQLQ